MHLALLYALFLTLTGVRQVFPASSYLEQRQGTESSFCPTVKEPEERSLPWGEKLWIRKGSKGEDASSQPAGALHLHRNFVKCMG